MIEREMSDLDPGLNFFGHRVVADGTLDDLERFLAVVDDFLRESARRLRGKYDCFGPERSAPFEEAFPEILYASVITSVVTFLERESKAFTDALREACGSPIGARELSGAWLERFRKYCEKIAGLSLDLTDAEWEDMKGVVEIRNCLVHADGWLVDFRNRSTVEAFMRRHRLVMPDHDYLRSDLALATTVLQKGRVFIEHIYRVALQRYRKP